jgi:hypothetical protein
MSKWEHLFVDGEFGVRSHLLSGLTAGQVAMRPAGASHSIYQELWHAATWQSIVVRRDSSAAAAWNSGGGQFPPEAPVSEQMWQEAVAGFLTGAEKALEWGHLPEALVTEVSAGVTLADVLGSLAVHNAYHFGKIVALRQLIGAWPPPAQESM